MADPEAPSSTEPSFSETLKSLKRDPDGKSFVAIGQDGVARSLDRDYNILDAKGLSPRQLKQFLDSGPYNPEAEKQWRGVDGRKITSEEGLFRPDPSILPKKTDARRESDEEKVD